MKHTEYGYLKGNNFKGSVDFNIIKNTEDGESFDYICDVTKEEEAAFIVKACNNHEKLIGMLKDISRIIDNSEAWWMDCPDKGGFDRELIDEIIEQAEKDK